MYLTKELKPEILEGVEISNQKQIIEESEFPLDLKLTWEEIKRRTDNFQIEDESMLELDTMLAEFLKKKGIDLSPKEPEKEEQEQEESELIEIEEEERQRQIKLIKIKLKLNLN